MAIPVNSTTDSELETLQLRAQTFYLRAWGKPWPRETKTLDRVAVLDTDRAPTDDTDVMDVDELKDDTDIVDDAPDSSPYEYVCLTDVKMLQDTFRPTTMVPNVIVCLQMYSTFIDSMKSPAHQHRKGFVVTGQPGIGKTTFLLYLLLQRLHLKQPTAIQFHSNRYFIFDHEGAVVRELRVTDDRLAGCWALTDSNAKVNEPCEAFLSNAQCVVQTTPPKPIRWKEWTKQKVTAAVLVMDLPHGYEIAAVMKELQLGSFDIHRVFGYVKKWGPSIRTIQQLVWEHATGNTEYESALERATRNAADAMHQVFSTWSMDRLLDSQCSSLIFVRPLRLQNQPVAFREWEYCVPTEYLQHLLHQILCTAGNQHALSLFELLSTHSLTRTAAGWQHELRMHRRLCTGNRNLGIFRNDQGDVTRHIEPSTVLLPGTLNSLRGVVGAGTFETFYWIPSAVNFPGVDSVLGDESGNIYALQATVAGEHSNPTKGLQKLWNSFSREARTRRKWHFVVVANTRKIAEKYLREYPQDFMLGTNCPVDIWASVL